MSLPVDELLGLLAHELRAPIATLRSAVQLGQLRGPGPSTFEIIDRQTRQLERILDELEDYSRSERQVLSIERAPCDLRAVAERSVRWVEPLRLERGHALTVTGDGERVMADAFAVERIVRNLLWNAIQYDPGAGVVELRVVAGGLDLLDRGVGLPDDIEPLFEPFARWHPSGCSAVGPGLGLTVARSLARLHGGDVALCPRDGGGAVASLRLP